MDLNGRLAVVFGGSGFIGRYVIRALGRAGARVRVAMRQPHLGGELRLAGAPGQIQIVQANLRDADSLARAVAGADIAVNLVGVLYSKGKQNFHQLHVAGAEAFGRAAAEIPHLVHLSALGADANARSAYARTKAEGEAALRAVAPHAAILRPSVVFGPEDQFLNRFARMAASGPALPLIGFGRPKFQPIYVEDLAKAVLGALGHAEPGARPFELGGPKVYSLRAVYDLVSGLIDRRVAYAPIPFFAAGIAGALIEAALAPLPIAPPLTGGQVALLREDNIVPAGAGATIADLVADPLETMEAVAPRYLWRYRDQGQFHKFAAS